MRKLLPEEEKYRAALEAREAGRQAEAFRLLKELAIAHPDVVVFHWMLGYEQLDAKLPGEAVESFTEAINLDHECVPAWGGLGQAHADLCQWDLAVRSFQKRLELSESPNHYIFLSEALRSQGDYLGALRCCDKAIALRPDSEAYLNLGITYCDLGLWDQASDAFETAIAQDPNDPRAIAELGYLRLGQGSLDTAEQLLRQALALEECPPGVHAYLALALEAKGRYNEATREFKIAFRAGRDDDFCISEYRKFRRRERKRTGF
jgi:tetratricopeptide (TPR) repeat protein